jgi:hypothetical protein
VCVIVCVCERERERRREDNLDCSPQHRFKISNATIITSVFLVALVTSEGERIE